MNLRNKTRYEHSAWKGSAPTRYATGKDRSETHPVFARKQMPHEDEGGLGCHRGEVEMIKDSGSRVILDPNTVGLDYNGISKNYRTLQHDS